MKLLYRYIFLLQNSLEKLSRIKLNKKLSNDIDKSLLERYKFIEKLIDEELNEN